MIRMPWSHILHRSHQRESRHARVVLYGFKNSVKNSGSLEIEGKSLLVSGASFGFLNLPLIGGSYLRVFSSSQKCDHDMWEKSLRKSQIKKEKFRKLTLIKFGSFGVLSP